MKLGIIGAGGYWGEKWVRNLKDMNILGGICETNESNSHVIELRYALTQSNIIIENDVNIFLENQFDGIIIATPPFTHFEIARKALIKHHNILVEKPFVIKTAEGFELEKLMMRRENILMTGHTFVYHPAIRELKKALIVLGDLERINIIRTNWGKYQDVGILYDLFPHDLSIANYLLGSFPNILNGYVDSQEDFAFITYEINNITCSSYLSWCSTNKERRIEIIGSQGIAVWNLDKGVINVRKYQENSDKNDLLKEKDNLTQISYSKNEPLAEEAKHFLDCIKNKTNPMTNIAHGIQITRLVQEFLQRKYANNTSKQICKSHNPTHNQKLQKSFSVSQP